MANDWTVAIAGIGLATAQGNSPTELPWEPSRWNVSRICYPALDSTLSGAARWRALVKQAFADLGEEPLTSSVPLFVGSCNGDASRHWEHAFDISVLLEDTPWAKERLPVFSSSCASGIHALYAAKQLLIAGAIDQAVVLAADILSQSNHDNFESLRILAEKPAAPWQPASQGFILGEAAVVLRLVRTESGNLSGPELGSDLVDRDGLAGVVGALSPQSPSLIIGQGTGPYENDAAELSVFSTYVDKDVPLATPLSNFGHTLGASGLLAVALAALKPDVLSLTDTAIEAMDGRRILCRGGHGVPPLQKVLTTCRALNGACAATMVGVKFRAETQRRKGSWGKRVMPGPLMNQVLKQLASEALDHRPKDPPDVFILRLEKPLSPPQSAIIGNRLLPSAVLEITPGFASQLVARCWGFSGPSLCLVGDVDQDLYGFTNALNQSGLNVFQVNLRGSGENRVVEWNV
jgi:hypothetical protein